MLIMTAWIPMSANMRVQSVTSWINTHLGKRDQSRSELKSPGSMMIFVQRERSVVNWNIIPSSIHENI